MSKPKKSDYKDWFDRLEKARDDVQAIAQEMRDAIDEWEPKEGSPDEEKRDSVSSIIDDIDNIESDISNVCSGIADNADLGT